ncbi:3-deoxy-D-arabino-heptulosonate 7-phosphate (DAHP) synthase [Sphingomonas sp. SORGH_AS 950]|uniref:hypothetical protein n=1 Tax=Sphingomonas sp. SORGH_AS_0950 TaxID=3041792 RepID=UPI002782C1EF|nr:hypothetical protein [Sphingomonas sp. SORGH_AS_0950]MDQ1159532.1 3-deoxy-D-arabino-heptulosonate 7-phosphate (DAHP) synthase [Sphingomonas sp. SORGH_AS_0950]
MDWIKLIGGGFAHGVANFGLHDTDQDKAERYAIAVVDAGLGWDDVEAHVNAYADHRNWDDDKRGMEMENVRSFMSDWL